MVSHKKFFDKISENCNYADPESLKTFYFGLLKACMKDLRENGYITFPDFGEFRIVTRSPRKIRHVKSMEIQYIPEVKVVKFYPCTKLKYYVRNKI